MSNKLSNALINIVIGALIIWALPLSEPLSHIAAIALGVIGGKAILKAI
jgi:putative flippase GtrA